jgi:membrane-bound inhibitor of C-type lysozyme
MQKYIFLFGAAAALFFTACCGNAQRGTQPATDEIVACSLVDAEGVRLELSFNNTNGTAHLTFKGEVLTLVEQRPASGIWYKNDRYELRGKGKAVELRKDGAVVFTACEPSQEQDSAQHEKSKSL